MASAEPSPLPAAPSTSESFLRRIPLEDLPHKPLLFVSKETSVEEVLKFLRTNKILSCPVVDVTLKPSHRDYCIGVVSVGDISKALCFQKIFSSYDTDEKAEQITESVLQSVKDTSLLKKPISDLIGATEESSQLFMFEGDDPLETVMETFSCGIHRVLVRASLKGGQEHELRFISQGDAVNSVMKHASSPELANILDKKICELRLGSFYSSYSSFDSMDDSKKTISVVHEDSNAVTAYRIMGMGSRKYHALPVVDSDGALVDTISETDLRGIDADSISQLLKRIPDFLKYSRGDAAKPVKVTCSAEDKLSSVASKLLQLNSHRAWMVNEKQQPIGCVSLTDICAAFSYV